MGAFAPVAPRIAARVPMERALVACALLTAAGTGLRGLGTTASLFAAGLAIGVAIAIAQALLPVLIRTRFPQDSGLLTGALSMALVLGSVLAAGLAVPLEHALGGWPESLAFWALPALVAALVWLPGGAAPGHDGRARRRRAAAPLRPRVGGERLLRRPVDGVLRVAVVDPLDPRGRRLVERGGGRAARVRGALRPGAGVPRAGAGGARREPDAAAAGDRAGPGGRAGRRARRPRRRAAVDGADRLRPERRARARARAPDPARRRRADRRVADGDGAVRRLPRRGDRAVAARRRARRVGRLDRAAGRADRDHARRAAARRARRARRVRSRG